MKAYVLEGIGRLVYKDIPIPQLEENEALVEVVNAGICGSDIPRIYETGTYHFPTIPGHEFAGVVRETGNDRYAYLIGKRVGVFPLIPCMKCEQCQKQSYEMCQSYNYLGSRTDGGFAEYVAVPVWNLIELPAAVSFEDAAMLEPTCVALHAVRQIDMTTVASAVVYGCGTIGTLVIQWLTSIGIENLYVIGTKKEQQDFLAGYATCFFCNCREQNPVDFIMEQTNGRGTDAVFECAGVSESINNAISVVKAGGQAVFVGNPAGDIILEKQAYWKILRRQITIHGTWNSSYKKTEDDDWHKAIKAIQEGKIRPSSQITHRFVLSKLQEGLETMRDRDIFTNKVMLNRL